LAAKFIDKIKVYCYKTPCISHDIQSLIHVELYCTFSADHALPVSHSIAFQWIASLPPLERLDPSVSISESRRCTIDCGRRDHPPPRF